MLTEKRKRLLECALFFFLFTLLSQGYRYMNLGFSGDATLICETGDTLYQISLGRFLQPLYWHIRGALVVPSLVGLFSCLFLSLGVYLCLELLSLRDRLSRFFVCGILATNELLSLSNATYLPWTDVYSLAFLLAALGVFSFFRLPGIRGFLLSAVCFCLSLGLYPSYLTSACTLYVLVFARKLLRGMPLRPLWQKGLFSILSLFAGLCLYALVLKAVLAIFHMPPSQEYNGVGRVGEITMGGFLSNVPEVYLTPIRYFFDPVNRQVIPSHRTAIPAVLNYLVFASAAIACVPVFRTLSPAGKMTLLFLLLILPFSANFVVFMSDGIVNGLMIFAYFFFYLLPLVFLPESGCRPIRIMVSVSLSMLIAFNVAIGNQLAEKRDAEYKATLSAVTRILGDAENIPEYEPGITPVYIYGFLPSSRISMERKAFSHLSAMQGARYTYAASYEVSTNYYLKQILGDPLLLCDSDRIDRLFADHIPDSLPKYPAQGYLTMADGVLVIRL